MMRHNLGIVTINTWVIVFFSVIYPAGDWNGIIPLESTQSDVESILGRPAAAYPGQLKFKHSEGTVVVSFSGNPECKQVSKETTWNVPKDVVTSITVMLRKPIPETQLPADRLKLKRVEMADDIDRHYYYIDEKGGSAIEMIQGFAVTYMFVPPGSKNTLRCSIQ